jgi:hypothetical protein
MSRMKTSNEIKQFRHWIREVAFELRNKVYAQEYELSWSWSEEYDHPDYVKSEKQLWFEITVDVVYLYIRLDSYMPAFKAWQKGDLRIVYEKLVHEFCHVLLIPLVKEIREEMHPNSYSFIRDIHERQTQRIANVILFSDFTTVPWKKKIIKPKRT